MLVHDTRTYLVLLYTCLVIMCEIRCCTAGCEELGFCVVLVLGMARLCLEENNMYLNMSDKTVVIFFSRLYHKDRL